MKYKKTREFARYTWVRTSMSRLELQNVNAFYGDSHVLHDVSLSVEEGQLVTLIGRNGAGKTTTLRSIMGTVDAEGELYYGDTDLLSLETEEIARQGIAIIPEERRLFNELTVRENLKMGHIGHERGKDEINESFEQVFEYFPRLEERQNQVAGQMSGGEQQMLSIGRAIMSDPDLLLIDEPTEGLMPTLVEKLEEILVRINNDGITILLVEQNVDLALEISDFAYILDEGVIRQEGPSEELQKDDQVKERYIVLG